MKTISGPRLIAAWLILLMLVFFLALGVFSLTLCIYDMVRKPTRVTSWVVKEKMSYHGTWGTVEEKGTIYFTRNPNDIDKKEKWVRL